MRTRFCIARMLVVLTLLWGLASTAMAQNRQIAGTVTDAKGRALQGVSVSVAGTNTFTTTDANGKFTLSLKKPDDQVSFAYVGYVTKKVAPGTQSQLSVVLAEDESTTSEVVVTGYTAQRKKDITGAVTVVNAKQLTSVPAASVTQMLQGRAAGVNVGNDNSPGGGTMVRIRGFGTVNNNSPLYIIDGVPTQGTLNQINPNDIESMQVLKDASSASIYGARAANGVVIITTKKVNQANRTSTSIIIQALKDPIKCSTC